MYLDMELNKGQDRSHKKDQPLPFFFATGIDSPVISDSSHVECPYMTFPSTGTFAPGTTCQQIHYCEVQDSHRSNAEDSRILGSAAVSGI